MDRRQRRRERKELARRVKRRASQRRKHALRARAQAPAPQHLEAITAHVERHIGDVAFVLHELHSTYVHVDVLAVAPTPVLPQWTLVTSGMSDRPILRPRCCEPGPPAKLYRELILALPAHWPLDQPDTRAAATDWPVRDLRSLARYPHRLGAYVDWQHTVGTPDARADPGCPYPGALFAGSQTLPRGVRDLEAEGHAIAFMSVYPLFPSELRHARRHGSESLIDRLLLLGVTDRLDPTRPPCC